MGLLKWFTIGAMIIIYFSFNKVFILITLLTVILFSGYVFNEVLKSKNIDNKKTLWSMWILVFVIGETIVKLTTDILD
jgi:hypothetical protein